VCLGRMGGRCFGRVSQARWWSGCRDRGRDKGRSVSRLKMLKLSDSSGGDKDRAVVGLIPARDADGSRHSRGLDAKCSKREWSGTAFHSRIEDYAWARGTRLSKPTIQETEMKSLAMLNGCVL